MEVYHPVRIEDSCTRKPDCKCKACRIAERETRALAASFLRALEKAVETTRAKAC